MKYNYIAYIFIISMLSSLHTWATDSTKTDTTKEEKTLPRRNSRASIYGYLRQNNSPDDNIRNVQHVTNVEIKENYDPNAQKEDRQDNVPTPQNPAGNIAATGNNVQIEKTDQNDTKDENVPAISKIDALRSELENAQQEKVQLQSELEAFKVNHMAEIEKLQSEYAKVKAENETLRKPVNGLEQNFVDLSKDYVLRSELQKVQQEENELQSQFEAFKTAQMEEIKKLKIEYSKLMIEKVALDKSAGALETLSKNLELDRNEKTKELQTKQKLVEFLTHEQEELSAKLTPLQLEVTTLKDQNVNLTTTLTTLRPQAEIMQKLIPVELFHDSWHNWRPSNYAPIQIYIPEKSLELYTAIFNASPWTRTFKFKK